jgi:hypothetical protein
LLGAPRGRHPDAAHARRVLGSITLKNTNPAALEGSGVGDYKTGCGGVQACGQHSSRPLFTALLMTYGSGSAA